MQMGRGDPAGLADGADNLSDGDVLARLDRYLPQMAIHGEQTLAMVDKDCIAVKEIFPGHHDLTGPGRFDRRSFGRCDIETAVRVAWLFIEKPA